MKYKSYKDTIFNNASRSMIPDSMWEQLEKWPALKKYCENRYFLEQMERDYPEEYKIMKDMYDEAVIVGRLHQDTKELLHRFIVEHADYFEAYEIAELTSKVEKLVTEYKKSRKS